MKPDYGHLVSEVLAAVQSHLDGDPRPRKSELRKFNKVRRSAQADSFMLIIATPTEDGQHFDYHPWVVFERRGRVVYEPGRLEIVPDEEGGGRST